MKKRPPRFTQVSTRSLRYVRTFSHNGLDRVTYDRQDLVLEAVKVPQVVSDIAQFISVLRNERC